MAFQSMITNHFVKNEDLNHHGTLFAGRTAEWFVESGLMAAAQHIPSENIVCVKIHGMEFTKPIHLGEIVRFESRAVLAGRSSLTVNIRVSVGGEQCLDGFITYVNVDENGKPFPHNLKIEPEGEEEAVLQEQARQLPRK